MSETYLSYVDRCSAKDLSVLANKKTIRNPKKCLFICSVLKDYRDGNENGKNILNLRKT